jgi:hypothetical protein
MAALASRRSASAEPTTLRDRVDHRCEIGDVLGKPNLGDASDARSCKMVEIDGGRAPGNDWKDDIRTGPAAREGRMRISDLEIVVEVVTETAQSDAPRGIRAEVAKRRVIGRTIVTDAIRRIEAEIGVMLFEADSLSLTPSGMALAEHGPAFLEAQRIFIEFIQRGRRRNRSENPND